MYQRIRDLREDCDLTQKNMGEILNCSQRIYSNYECGDVDIPTHILIKLPRAKMSIWLATRMPLMSGPS